MTEGNEDETETAGATDRFRNDKRIVVASSGKREGLGSKKRDTHLTHHAAADGLRRVVCARKGIKYLRGRIPTPDGEIRIYAAYDIFRDTPALGN